MKKTATIKFNNGNFALLCTSCSKILKVGYEFNEEEVKYAKGEIDIKPMYCNSCVNEKLNNSKLKYKIPKEKYTTDEFLSVYNKREKKLVEDYKALTLSEAKKRFSKLFKNCPIGLHIDPFGLMELLNQHFPDWSKNDRVFKINKYELEETDNKFILKETKRKINNSNCFGNSWTPPKENNITSCRSIIIIKKLKDD